MEVKQTHRLIVGVGFMAAAIGTDGGVEERQINFGREELAFVTCEL